jgi:hypothetical protein
VKKFMRKLMVTNTVGDGFALIVGQGIYREVLARELARGVAESEAKETAGRELFNIIEKTQASAQIKDMSKWQRRGNFAIRFFSQFTGPLTRLASYEIQAFREVRAGTPGAKKKFLNTIIVNHLLMPAIYEAVAVAWKAALGEPPDDDEVLSEFLVAALSGPAAGLIIFGPLAEHSLRKLITGKTYGDSLASVSTAAGISDDLLDLAAHLTWDFNFEEATNDTFDVLSKVVKPIKDIRKLYENRIAD